MRAACLFLLNTTVLFCQTADKTFIDIRHYEFNISVNDDNNVIEGVAAFNSWQPNQ